MAASTGPGRREFGIGAVVLLVAAAGCTGNGSDDPPATDPPSPTSSPSPVDLVTDDPYYPAEAQEYAELAVAAWASPDLYRLGELVAGDVRQELLELPGPPERGWRLISCEPAAEDELDPQREPDPADAVPTTECAFYNLAGDHLWLSVDGELLGDAQAVTGIEFDPIVFPDDPVAYVAAYIAAWQEGNVARAQALATDGVIATFAELPPVGDPTYELAEPTNAFDTVVIDFDPASTDDDSAAVEVTVSVNPSLLGQAQALRTAAHDLA